MSLWLSVLILIVAIGMVHWGAEQFSAALRQIRRHWGLSTSAGGAVLAIGSASPEVAINVMSAVRGVPEIGLGALLGANLIANPLVVTGAYIARHQRVARRRRKKQRRPPRLSEDLLPTALDAIGIHAVPYLLILALVAILTLPAPWRGLQPVDGWIMLAAYLAYFGRALFRKRRQPAPQPWSWKHTGWTAAGLVVLGVGANLAVRATENIASELGISALIGGLFITGSMSALPEVFAAWAAAKRGETTAASSSVIADQATTMTLGFFPIALITVQIEQFELYWISLLFLALLTLAYATSILSGTHRHGLTFWQVLLIDGIYLAYLVIVVFGVLGT